MEGNLGVKLRGFWYLRFCTITHWESVEAMQAFVRSPAHAEAMRFTNALGKGIVYHSTGDELPSWREALALIEEHGRRVMMTWEFFSHVQ